MRVSVSKRTVRPLSQPWHQWQLQEANVLCVQRSKLANPSEAKRTLDAAKRLYNNGKKRLTGRSENSTHAIRAELSRDSDLTAAGTIPAIRDKVLSAATIAPAAGQITRMLAAPKLGPSRGADGSKVERNKQ